MASNADLWPEAAFQPRDAPLAVLHIICEWDLRNCKGQMTKMPYHSHQAPMHVAVSVLRHVFVQRDAVCHVIALVVCEHAV